MNSFAYLNEFDDTLELLQRPRVDTALKNIGDPALGRVGGYLVVWGSPEQRDLHGDVSQERRERREGLPSAESALAASEPFREARTWASARTCSLSSAE